MAKLSFSVGVKRLLARSTAIHVLLVIAVLELVINRVTVPLWRPVRGIPPRWHTLLDYAGLFLFYFAGTLAAFILIARCLSAIRARRGIRDTTAHAIAALATVLAAIPLVIGMPAWMGFFLEIAFAAAVVAFIASTYRAERDLGVLIGLPLVALPLLLHTVLVFVQHFWPDAWHQSWPDGFSGDTARSGLLALSIAGLLTPYCFSPRPFVRAVVRPAPLAIAIAILVAGMVIARATDLNTTKVASLALGAEMTNLRADYRLPFYILAVATLAWTLASCAIASTEARRTIGAGLALMVLGGYAFRWLGGYAFRGPHHYLLPLLGVALVADAVRRVREEELAALPIFSVAPPIADPAWSAYIGAIVHGLRRMLVEVHSLTTRGEGGITSSVIVGEVAAARLPVRIRIERIEGCVLALDVVVGREIDELSTATLSVWAIPERGHGANPLGPPAAPPFRSGDPQFDDRFKVRGDAAAFAALFDDGLRARAAATLDGWVAYWARDGLRYRIYPGRGAPVDHPMPLSDLALGRVPPTEERLVAVVELLVAIAERGVEPAAPAEPAELTTPEAV